MLVRDRARVSIASCDALNLYTRVVDLRICPQIQYAYHWEDSS